MGITGSSSSSGSVSAGASVEAEDVSVVSATELDAFEDVSVLLLSDADDELSALQPVSITAAKAAAKINFFISDISLLKICYPDYNTDSRKCKPHVDQRNKAVKVRQGIKKRTVQPCARGWWGVGAKPRPEHETESRSERSSD